MAVADGAHAQRGESHGPQPRPSRATPGSAPDSGRGGPEPRPLAELYRGRTRLALIRDLAMGEWTPRELAKQLDTTVDAVITFQNDHADEISEVRAALAGHLAIETAGLWVTKRQNRLAEYQADIEDLGAVLDQMREIGASFSHDGPGLGTKRHYNVLRSKLMLMKAVADELSPSARGVKPGEEDRNVVHYIIEADDVSGSLT